MYLSSLSSISTYFISHNNSSSNSSQVPFSLSFHSSLWFFILINPSSCSRNITRSHRKYHLLSTFILIIIFCCRSKELYSIVYYISLVVVIPFGAIVSSSFFLSLIIINFSPFAAFTLGFRPSSSKYREHFQDSNQCVLLFSVHCPFPSTLLSFIHVVIVTMHFSLCHILLINQIPNYLTCFSALLRG